VAETTIEWADYTFNPWVGCQRVSPGCEHCYAEAYDKRVGGAPKLQRADPSKPQLRWGANAERVRTSLALWKQPLRWNREAAAAGQRRRVFCASLADVFDMHESIDATWRLELFSVIRQTPHLDWLLLTKRPENFWAALKAATAVSARHNGYMASPEGFEETRLWLHRWLDGHPPENVWGGTTVEDQRRVDERTPVLFAIPLWVRFLSVEPLLGGVRLLLEWHSRTGDVLNTERIDWVIVGGESGGKARRFNVAWARSVLRQCRKAGVPAFMKQMGANVIDRNDAGFNGDEGEERGWCSAEEYGGHIRVEENIDGYRDDYQGAPVRVHLQDRAGGDPAEWPRDLRVRQFPEVRHG
jgi:protein gp37